MVTFDGSILKHKPSRAVGKPAAKGANPKKKMAAGYGWCAGKDAFFFHGSILKLKPSRAVSKPATKGANPKKKKTADYGWCAGKDAFFFFHSSILKHKRISHAVATISDIPDDEEEDDDMADLQDSKPDDSESDDDMADLKEREPDHSECVQVQDDEDAPSQSPLNVDQKRMLLQSFVPASMAWEDIVKERWHLKSQATSTIQKVFDERFGRRLTLANVADVYDNGIAGMTQVQDALEAVRENKRQVKDMACEEFKSINAKKNKAIEATRALTLSLDPMGLILRHVHHFLGKRGTALAHDGSSTYAEPRKNNINDLCQLLLRNKLVSVDDVVVDFGSGAMTALVHMCQIWRCRGLGIEYSENRVYAAASYLKQLFTIHLGNPSFNPQVVCFVANIMAMERMLKTCTILYMFDEAFPPELMSWICEMINNAPLTLRIVIAAKAMKDCETKKSFAQDSGLYQLMAPLHCTKIGSGESSTFCVYGRDGLDYGEGFDLFPPPDGTPVHAPQTMSTVPDLTSIDVLAQNFFASTTAAKIQYYEALIERTHQSMSAKRERKKKDASGCYTASYSEHCGDRGCPSCHEHFLHSRMTSLERKRVDWLPAKEFGLFTKLEIKKGAFIIQYCGKPCDGSKGGPYVLKIGNNKYVDAKGRGIHQFVNHCCEPNCQLHSWKDASGKDCVSIVSLADIGENQELTVHYGPSRELFDCICRHCTGQQRERVTKGNERSKSCKRVSQVKRNRNRLPSPPSKSIRSSSSSIIKPFERDGLVSLSARGNCSLENGPAYRCVETHPSIRTTI